MLGFGTFFWFFVISPAAATDLWKLGLGSRCRDYARLLVRQGVAAGALLRASAILPSACFHRAAAAGALDRSSAMVFVTGPSRTADIELTLTIGVHGPRALHVIIVLDR